MYIVSYAQKINDMISMDAEKKTGPAKIMDTPNNKFHPIQTKTKKSTHERG